MRPNEMNLETLARLPGLQVPDLREALFAIAAELETVIATAQLSRDCGVDRFGAIAVSLCRVSDIVRTTLQVDQLQFDDATTGCSLEAAHIQAKSALTAVMAGLTRLLDAEEIGEADQPGVKEFGLRQLTTAWVISEQLLANEPFKSASLGWPWSVAAPTDFN